MMILEQALPPNRAHPGYSCNIGKIPLARSGRGAAKGHRRSIGLEWFRASSLWLRRREPVEQTGRSLRPIANGRRVIATSAGF